MSDLIKHKVPHIEVLTSDFDDTSGVFIISKNPIKLKICVPSFYRPGILTQIVAEMEKGWFIEQAVEKANESYKKLPEIPHRACDSDKIITIKEELIEEIADAIAIAISNATDEKGMPAFLHPYSKESYILVGKEAIKFLIFSKANPEKYAVGFRGTEETHIIYNIGFINIHIDCDYTYNQLREILLGRNKIELASFKRRGCNL